MSGQSCGVEKPTFCPCDSLAVCPWASPISSLSPAAFSVNGDSQGLWEERKVSASRGPGCSRLGRCPLPQESSPAATQHQTTPASQKKPDTPPRLQWACEHMEVYLREHSVQKPRTSPREPNRLERLLPHVFTEGTCHWEVNDRRLKCVYCLHSKRTSCFTYTQAAKANTLGAAGASGPGRAAKCPPRA